LVNLGLARVGRFGRAGVRASCGRLWNAGCWRFGGLAAVIMNRFCKFQKAKAELADASRASAFCPWRCPSLLGMITKSAGFKGLAQQPLV